MTYHVDGKPLLNAEITMPRVGAWRARLKLDSETLLSGAVTLDLNGIQFRGTVLRSGAWGGTVRARIVGGNRGLSRELPARNYAAGVVKVGAVVIDVVRECGETLAPDCDQSLLERQLPQWHRAAGPAGHALVSILDAVQATFRILPSGTVWIGIDTFPEVTPPHVLVDEDWSAGVFTFDAERPELAPGTTFRGQKIEQVIHRLSRNQLRIDAHLTSARSSLSRFLGHIRRQIDYSRDYPCRVSLQNADGTLQLVADDAQMKGSGLDRVPIRHGLPGIKKVRVAVGARVTLRFDAGDPARPYAALWESGGVIAVEFEGRSAPVARMGDPVQVFFPPTPLPITGTVAGSPFVGTILIATPALAVIQGGNPKLLA